MTTKKYLIADGNSTIIVWDSPPNQRLQLNETLLQEVEQIGYVSPRNELPSFEMMGGELSINGTLAYASTLGSSGELYTSGIPSPVQFINSGEITSITAPLTYTIHSSTVLFEGIGYIYREEAPENIATYLGQQAEFYALPAFGLLLFNNDVLFPTIYVRETDSCVAESACGSGSIALALLKNLEVIKQPSGGIITIKNDTEAFTITAKVVQIQ